MILKWANVVIKFSKIHPMKILILIGLVMGIFLCTFIPYGAGFDEEEHLVRIFDISGLNLIPNRSVSQGNYTFSEFHSLSYLNLNFQNPILDQFKKENFLKNGDWNNMDSGITRSVYFPFAYFPQSIVAGLAWRVFNFPILPTVIVMRLVGFLIYLFACCLTMHLLPFGKWIFLVLALSPTALFQAATLNVDGFTNLVSFLFIGLILKIFGQKDIKIKQSDGCKIFLASLLLGFAKPGTIILLLLLGLISLKRNSMKVNATIIAGVILSVIVSLGWAALAVVNSNVNNTGTSLLDKIVLVLNNLGDFLPIYFKGLFLSLKIYYQEMIGALPYGLDKVPVAVYWLFTFSIIFAYLTETKNPSFRIKDRLVIFLVSLFCLGLIASFMFIFDYQPGHPYISSMGRYFLPFMPLFFLAWAGLIDRSTQFKLTVSFITTLLIIGTLGFFTLGFFRANFSNYICSKDADQPCKLPIYHNLDVMNPPIISLGAKKTITQTFKPVCSNISDIEVRIWSMPDNLTGSLQLSLLDVADHIIHTSQVSLAQIQPKDQIAFKFPEVRVNKGDVYHFDLVFLNPFSLASDLGIMGRKGDYYTDGALFINGNASKMADDLFFLYTCTP